MICFFLFLLFLSWPGHFVRVYACYMLFFLTTENPDFDLFLRKSHT